MSDKAANYKTDTAATERRTGAYSVELLHHFRCANCAFWFSIGDIPKAGEVFEILKIPVNPLQGSKPVWTCPWCAVTQEFKEVKS